MPWRSIGVAIAVIVAFLIALGRVSGIVVDWAWFSTIGYVDVFWTIFAAKAVLFVAVFAVSSLAALGERNAGIAVCVAATTAAPGGVRSGLHDGPDIAAAADRALRTRIAAGCCGVCSSWPSLSSSDC